MQKGCELIISHHPIVFKGLKKFTGKSYVERVVIKAIKNEIALYAIHTNLDNVSEGVNFKIADKLGLHDCSILSPKSGMLKKLVTFCPLEQADKVRSALFEAGAGSIGNYSDCSFNLAGYGTFKAGERTHPFAGEQGELHREEEIRIETIFPANLEKKLLVALFTAHPYEEVAYDIYGLSNSFASVGPGAIGNTSIGFTEAGFLSHLKEKMQVTVVRHTALRNKKVRRVAVCGGAGGFLLQQAINAGADFFITADYKYHEFFDADGKIVIADIGHFESEQFTQELLLEIIRKKFPTFAVRLTEQNTNPINYFI
jgi:dinuclear metal center YbgI/SA1388 family protein